MVVNGEALSWAKLRNAKEVVQKTQDQKVPDS